MRYILLILIFSGIWGLMLLRLDTITTQEHDYYAKLAKDNIKRKYFIKPVRGAIVDRNNKILAINRLGFSVAIEPHIKSNSERFGEVLSLLGRAFEGIDLNLVARVYQKHNSPYNHKYITVIDFVEYGKMMSVYPELIANDCFEVKAQTKRYYPYGKYAAHIVGYTGRSNKKENAKDFVVSKVGVAGKSGLERYYNSLLQGDLGEIVAEVSSNNKLNRVLSSKKASSNHNIKLNLDIDLQIYIHDMFEKNHQTGVAVVMDTQGRVLSAVSFPSYDPNIFVGGISTKEWVKLRDDVNRPFTNKIVHGLYPPGSTIKMGMALAFESAKPGILRYPEHCKGYIKIGKSEHKFRCWASWGHGMVPLRRAIRESCDVFFYNKALRVGINNISKQLNRFGLGVKSGVDMPREYRGVIPSVEWKKKRFKKSWYKGETVIAAIGQGYDLVTPLQLARYTAMVATSKLPVPFMAEILHNKTRIPSLREIKLNRWALGQIRLGMFDVCNSKKGTAFKTMSGLPIVVAGKTGTSQVSSIPQNVKKRLKESQLDYFKRSHAWITTYAPYKKPKYVVTVLVEHGGHGGSTAGPIAANIYKWMHKKGYFDQNKTTLSKQKVVEFESSVKNLLLKSQSKIQNLFNQLNNAVEEDEAPVMPTPQEYKEPALQKPTNKKAKQSSSMDLF